MDIVLLIDGSGSLGQGGWDAEIKAANLFVDRFEGTGKANIAVILFSGPRTWSGVYKCFHSHFNKNSVDKNICRITSDTLHPSKDCSNVSQNRVTSDTAAVLFTHLGMESHQILLCSHSKCFKNLVPCGQIAKNFEWITCMT